MQKFRCVIIYNCTECFIYCSKTVSAVHKVEEQLKVYTRQQFFSRDFPFAIVHTSNSSDYFNVSRRFKREFWKITYVVRGSGNLVIGNMFYPVSPQSLIIVHPEAQTTWDMKNSELEVYNIVFDRSLIENAFADIYDAYHFMRIFSDDYHQEDEFPLFMLKAGENEISLIHRMYSEFESAYPNRKQMILLELCELLLLMLRKINDSAYHHPEWIVKFADDYIEKHFRNKISIAAIAAQVGVSPEYFSRLYHRKTGSRIVEKIKKLRLEYAANELHSTDLPVSAICYRSGFNDISYFCRSFLAFYGCTPKNYRDKIGQN